MAETIAFLMMATVFGAFLLGMTWPIAQPILGVTMRGFTHMGSACVWGVKTGNRFALNIFKPTPKTYAPPQIYYADLERNRKEEDLSELVATWTYPVKINKDAIVHLRGYGNRVERRLVITGTLAKNLKLESGPSWTKKNLNRFGGRIDLGSMWGKFAYKEIESRLVAKTIADANEKIDDMRSILAGTLQTKTTKQVAAAPTNAMPEITPAPALIQEKVAEKVAVKEEVNAPTESSIPAPVVSKSKVIKEVWKGRLVTHGFGSRALSGKGDEGDEGNKIVSQYRVVILDDQSGFEETLWGTDLRRAITDANVVNGDRVEVMRCGKRKLENKKTMTIYSIQKLA